MNYDISAEQYELLYAKYIQKGCDQLFKNVNLEGAKVLDLCCGNGRASKYALEHGARFCVMIDSGGMKPDLPPEQARFFNRTIEGGIGMQPQEDFDVVVCQQAVNYWFDKYAVSMVWSALKKGGQFVFNTFGQQPSIDPKIKKYTIDGRHYTEVSNCDMNGVVHHSQYMTGVSPHHTSFDYIPVRVFGETLKEIFTTVGWVRYDNTVIFTAVK